MIQPRQYHTLIAGLPEIVPEQTKAPFSLVDWTQELTALLHPDDLAQLDYLLLPYCHELVLAPGVPAHPLSPYTAEEIAEKRKEPGQLPAYLDQFLAAQQEDQPIWQDMSWENQLTWLYYDYVIEKTSGFLSNWFRFDRNLRNLLSAWNSRELKWELDGQLIGHNEITGALRTSHQRDFGLTNEYPFLFRMLPLLEQSDLLEREKAILHIRWEYIDSELTFHYFTMEVILGYFLKLSFLERRLKFDQTKGLSALLNAIDQLEKKAETHMQKPASL
jgi:hypothetical protein